MNSASASDKLWSLICHYECELKEKNIISEFAVLVEKIEAYYNMTN